MAAAFKFPKPTLILPRPAQLMRPAPRRLLKPRRRPMGVKRPDWEQSPGALAALINGRKFVYADLLTIDFIPQPQPTFTLPMVACGEDGATFNDGRLRISLDGGLKWEIATPAEPTGTELFAVVKGAASFATIGVDNTPALHAEFSLDGGSDWSLGTLTLTPASVSFGNFNGSISAIAANGTGSNNYILTSADNEIWAVNAVTSATLHRARDIDYDGVGTWVIVGQDSDPFTGNPVVVTTTDFSSYADQAVPASYNNQIDVVRVCHGAGGFTMVGGALGSNTSFIFTSPDGKAPWTQRTLPTLPFGFVLYDVASNGSTIVAFGNSGNGTPNPFPVQPVILVSSDAGVTWTWVPLYMPLGHNSTAITWNGRNYVAVGSDGNYFTTPSILTSPDGFDWAVRLPVQTSLGSEIVSNPDFVASDAGYTFDAGNTTWSPGDFTTITAGGGGEDATVTIDVDTVSGQWYLIEAEQTISGDATSIYFNSGNSFFADSSPQTGNISFYMLADFTGTDQLVFDFDDYNPGATRHLTHISMRPVTFSPESLDAYLESVA